MWDRVWVCRIASRRPYRSYLDRGREIVPCIFRCHLFPLLHCTTFNCILRLFKFAHNTTGQFSAESCAKMSKHCCFWITVHNIAMFLDHVHCVLLCSRDLWVEQYDVNCMLTVLSVYQLLVNCVDCVFGRDEGRVQCSWEGWAVRGCMLTVSPNGWWTAGMYGLLLLPPHSSFLSSSSPFFLSFFRWLLTSFFPSLSFGLS